MTETTTTVETVPDAPTTPVPLPTVAPPTIGAGLAETSLVTVVLHETTGHLVPIVRSPVTVPNAPTVLPVIVPSVGIARRTVIVRSVRIARRRATVPSGAIARRTVIVRSVGIARRRATARSVGIARLTVIVRSVRTVLRRATARSVGIARPTVIAPSVLTVRLTGSGPLDRTAPPRGVREETTAVRRMGRGAGVRARVANRSALARRLRTGIPSASSPCVPLRTSRTCPTTSSLAISTRSPGGS